MKNLKAKKIFNIIGNAITYLFIALSVVFLLISITSKKSDDGATNIFGYEMRLVVSASMENDEDVDVSEYDIKDIPVKSMVFVERKPEKADELYQWYADLEVGDVLTFKYVYGNQVVITHRIIEIQEKDDHSGFIIQLRGDNKTSEDYPGIQTIDTSLEDTSPNYVIGKVVGKSFILGLIVYALSTPLGMALIIIVPCAIIIILEIIKIINAFNEEKNKKVKEEKDKQANEIEELKKQLAQLQMMQENKTKTVDKEEE